MKKLLERFESFFDEAVNCRTQLKKGRLPGIVISLWR